MDGCRRTGLIPAMLLISTSLLAAAPGPSTGGIGREEFRATSRAGLHPPEGKTLLRGARGF